MTSVTGPPPSVPVRRRANSRRRRKTMWAYLFLLPQLIGLLAFTVLPTLGSIGLSFTDWQLGSGGGWIGGENYSRVVTDRTILRAARNTVVFTAMYVPVLLVVALTIAVLMLRTRRSLALYQSAYFVPLVTSTAAAALVWTLVFQPDIGLANTVLGKVGLPKAGWFSSTAQALPTMVIVVLWATVGNAIILFTAGLRSIPLAIREAAMLDGASGLRGFRHITLPLVSPTTFFVLATTLIGSLQFFVEPYVITQGGPANATDTAVLELYRQAFTYGNTGLASALAFLLAVAIFAVTALQLSVSRWVNYDQ